MTEQSAIRNEFASRIVKWIAGYIKDNPELDVRDVADLNIISGFIQGVVKHG